MQLAENRPRKRGKLRRERPATVTHVLPALYVFQAVHISKIAAHNIVTLPDHPIDARRCWGDGEKEEVVHTYVKAVRSTPIAATVIRTAEVDVSDRAGSGMHVLLCRHARPLRDDERLRHTLIITQSRADI
jgi:hypothetical protein